MIMSDQVDINNFYDWATKIGCPKASLPDEDTLKSIFKTKSKAIFTGLTKLVQPMQNVTEVRDNIIIKKMDNYRNELVPSVGLNFLPDKIQNHFKITELQKKKNSMESKLDDLREEYRVLNENCVSKNLKCSMLEKAERECKIKNQILESTLKSLRDKITQEKENTIKIMETKPVEVTSKNVKEQKAIDGINEALEELEVYYKADNKGLSEADLVESRENLWKKMRQIFADIPNFLLYSVIAKLKDEQIQYIINLKKATGGNADSIYFSTTMKDSKDSTDSISPFEKKLHEAKSEIISIICDEFMARNEYWEIEKQFSNDYHAFVENLRKEVGMFCTNRTDDQIDEIITDYIVNFHKYHFIKAQHDFYTQQIEFYKEELEEGAKFEKDHEHLLQSVKELYNKISDSVNRIEFESYQLSKIKDKISHCKNLMLQKLSSMQRKNLKKLKRKDVSMSLLSTDGFEPGNDSFFSSTKLDFSLDGSISSLNSTVSSRSLSTTRDLTLMPAATNQVPSWVIEISTFLDTPLSKLNPLPKECVFYLAPNPLVFESSDYSTSVLKLAPGILLTAFGALQEVKKNINWAELIAKLSNDFEFDFEEINVDLKAFKEKRKQENELIIELLDKIDAGNNKTSCSLHQLQRCYDFLLDNPLRHHIPSTKLVANQTYAALEAEFLMYYRLTKADYSVD